MNFTTSISNIIAPQKVQQTMRLIDTSDKIVITSHLSPDGDAIGSSLALYHFLKNRGKQVRVIVPNAFPGFLKWMSGAGDIDIYEYRPRAGQYELYNADLIFSIDYNIPKRVGEMAYALEKSQAKKILIDHHLLPGSIFDVTVSYPEISSTSELLFRFFLQAGVYDEVTQTIGECIYCGMMTDTGGFTFNSSDPETYAIVSLLLRKGVNKDEIFSKVFHNHNEDRFRMLGFMLSQRMEIYPDQHAALVYLSKEDQSQFAVSKGETEGFVNYPLAIKGIIFSTFIREDDGLIKLSFRSQKLFPCNDFAAEFFGGGGHLNASGGEFHGTIEDAIALFKKGLAKYETKLKAIANEL
jgi:phosphoesterase RecJ-like protein